MYEVRVVDPVSGKRVSAFAGTEEAALQELKRLRREADQGLPLDGAQMTLERYLKAWLDGVRPAVKRSTYRHYEDRLRLHVIPHLGRVKLRALTPTHLRKLYGDLQKARESRTGEVLKQGLAPRRVGHVHRVLHNALGQAARDGLVARNVAALVAPPRVTQEEPPMLSTKQVEALLQAAASRRDHALYVLVISTGMREGELLGLRWADVELDSSRLRVRRTLEEVVKGEALYSDPKTARSRRVITLTKAAVAALREHRRLQAEERLKAAVWDDRDLVFPDKVGREQHSSNFYRDSWVPLRAAAGLPKELTFHGLRHAAASLMLAAGVPVATVSEMLGHANTAITLRTYAHAIPGDQQRAADAIDAMLFRSVVKG